MTRTHLAIVSNRLPFHAEVGPDGEGTLQRQAGGLATALHTLLEKRGGMWIGWSGDVSPERAELLARLCRSLPYRLVPITLPPEDVALYYQGFSNRTLWPLFHDFPGLTTFDPAMWASYLRTNQRFAEATLTNLKSCDTVWVHDFHLFPLGQHLRKARSDAVLGLFQHIPFPQHEIFRKLPWRTEILKAMLAYDLVGFQTRRDLGNFIDCVRLLIPRTRARELRGGRFALSAGRGAATIAGAFPIGIDFASYDGLARERRVQQKAAQLRRLYPGRKIILGIDRLDYSKGIPQRLRAFERMLDLHPEMLRKVTLLQLAVPSRADVLEYQRLRDEIDGLVGRINGRLSQAGWVPIHYLYRSLPMDDLVAFYHTCDVALVTPLKDGMNLVCQEFCAASFDGHGVLVLSEFAGAAELLGDGALLVNPYDVEGLGVALVRALRMPMREQRSRMHAMRRLLRQRTIHRWAEVFLRELESRRAARA